MGKQDDGSSIVEVNWKGAKRRHFGPMTVAKASQLVKDLDAAFDAYAGESADVDTFRCVIVTPAPAPTDIEKFIRNDMGNEVLDNTIFL